VQEVRKSPHAGSTQCQEPEGSSEEVTLLYCVGIRWQEAVGETVSPAREQSIYVCKAQTEKEIETTVWECSKVKEPTSPFGGGLSSSDKILRL